jgi:hypothetical protein
MSKYAMRAKLMKIEVKPLLVKKVGKRNEKKKV